MSVDEVQIVDLDTYDPSDQEILSLMDLLRAPDQVEWEYDPSWAQKPSSPRKEVKDFHKHRRKQRGQNHRLWALAGQRVVGMIGINRRKEPCRNHCGELGFGVLKDYARREIGYRLVMAAIAKAREVGLKRLEADCFSDNEASAALLRKSGFREEGVRVGAICRDGKPRDQRIFGLVL
ncbi:MAG: GNAT family N-acetyltransferase [Phycisphaerae bacterium]|nr:GNAT family N-acetyltransferase [Phycisphaerae bacterium]